MNNEVKMKKRLYKNLFGIIAIVIVSILSLDLLSLRGYTRELIAQLTDSDDYFANNGPDFINPLIRQAQKDDGTTALILGDSFAYQVFIHLKDYNPEISFLMSNGAVTMAGQYVIAKEYLDNHPEATDVYLLVLPESIGRTFDTKWGYQYAVLPFIETHTLADFNEETVQIMKDTYGELFMNETIATLVDKSGINRKLYLNYMREKTDGYKLSYYYELSDIYLMKLIDLCNSKNVNLYFYPCPVSEAKRDEVTTYEASYEESETYKINPDYFDMIYYYPAEWSEDNTHLEYEYRSPEYVDTILMELLKGSPLLEALKFG